MKKIKIRKPINKLMRLLLINTITFVVLWIVCFVLFVRTGQIDINPKYNPILKVRFATRLPIQIRWCNIWWFEETMPIGPSKKNYSYFITLDFLNEDNYQKILQALKANKAYTALPMPRAKNLPKTVSFVGEERNFSDIADFLFDIKKGYYRLYTWNKGLNFRLVVIDTKKQLIHMQVRKL